MLSVIIVERKSSVGLGKITNVSSRVTFDSLVMITILKCPWKILAFHTDPAVCGLFTCLLRWIP